MTCPRCSSSARYPTFEEDTFGCYSCGEVRFGIPLDIPLLWEKPVKPHSGGRKKKEQEPSFCMDCGVGITQGSKRCAPCANKAINAGLTKAGKRNHFGNQSITPRRTDVVASRRGSGL